MIVDPEGNFFKSYKKHFLYETDYTWASPGDGFEAFDMNLPKKDNRIVRVANGICMDINPKEFKADFEAFEFANFVKNEKC